MTRLDGNVLAGPLAELLGDPTTVIGECLGCHDTSALAQATVFTSGSRFVVRCHTCDTLLLVVIDEPGDTRVFLHEVNGLPLGS